MTLSRLSRLPMPARRYRVDLLMPGGKRRGGFETISETREEDCKREIGIASALATGSDLVDEHDAEDLADKLALLRRDLALPRSLALSTFCRECRIRLTGALLRFVADWTSGDLKAVTLLPRAWAVTPEALSDTDPNKLLAQLRSTLNRLGADETDGFAVFILHGEFDPGARVFQLHVHGLVGGGMIKVLEKLRTLRGYKSRPDVRWPVRFSRLQDPPRQLSYVFKSYWPSRRIGPVGPHRKRKRNRSHQRIEEPYHTQYLLWLDRFDISDISLLIGCRVKDGTVLATSRKKRRFVREKQD